MDYGKEAYIKVTELEQRVNSSPAKVSRVTSNGAVVYDGGAGILSVSLNEEGAHAVVYFDGTKMGEVSHGGSLAFVVTASGEITTDSGAEMTVCAYGAGTLSATLAKIVADEADGVIYACYLDGDLVLCKGTDSFTEIARTSPADDYDIAVGGGRILIGAVRAGEVSLELRSDSEALGSLSLGRGNNVAVTATESGWLVAVFDGDKVDVTSYASDLTVTESLTVHRSATTNALAFVKGGSTTLAVRDGERVIVRAIV